MQHRRDGDLDILVLARGESLMDSLSMFAQEEGIVHAAIQGLGAVEQVEIGYYELQTKSYHFTTYSETFEVASLVGNIALVDGKPFAHVHAVLSRCDETLSCIGGHVKDACVAVTLELHLRRSPEPITRRLDDTIGLKLICV